MPTTNRIGDVWADALFRLHGTEERVVGRGWHSRTVSPSYLEIWSIRRGRCRVAQAEEIRVAGAGDVVMFRPGRTRMAANAGTGELSIAGFGCAVVVGETVDLLGRFDLPLVLEDAPTSLRRLIDDVTRASASDIVARIFRARGLAELALAEILSVVGSWPPDVPVTGPLMRDEVRQALAYIAQGYPGWLDPESIARAVHLSPQHLSRCFRKSMGVTPMAYVRRYRLARARERLITTDLPIGRIARETGFVDMAHFSRAFKAQYGSSPRAYRNVALSLGPEVGAVGDELRAIG